MDGGMVLERGTHRELLEQNGRYAEMWRWHSRARRLRSPPEAFPAAFVLSRGHWLRFAWCPVLQLGLIGIHSASVARAQAVPSAPDPPSWRIHPASHISRKLLYQGCAYACRIRIKYAISKASALTECLIHIK
jgi:hypothetical protein